jgi:hypothetical protein
VICSTLFSGEVGCAVFCGEVGCAVFCGEVGCAVADDRLSKRAIVAAADDWSCRI